MSTATAFKHILIGTAGHIDHGKTRLVGRLTNINTDRLPEEKSRGISIDLGFAHWESNGIQFGVIDVPGHERFVKNMVAGATGINLALLVVAADDSVMLQTREHLEIMDLLGVKDGVVAITKIDSVDPDFVELVISEVEELVAGTFLEGSAILPVSSATGEGIETLKDVLTRVATEIAIPETQKYFRMPIDRVFSIAGHGTVVTGSVLSGEVSAGDTVELLPQGREIRVRSVQRHGLQAEDAGARQRTAINLAGVKVDEVSRGDELATPEYLRPTLRMVVELRSLASSPIELKDRMELNLHLGTKETPARINVKGHRLKPGEVIFAELRLKEPVLAAYGQRFILRRTSPPLTVAGGMILDPYIVPPQRRIKDLQAYGMALNTSSEVDRLSANLSQQDVIENAPAEAAWRVGVRADRYSGLLEELKAQKILVQIGSKDRPFLVHRGRLEVLSASVLRKIREELAKYQPRRALPRNTLTTACREITHAALLDAIFAELIAKKQLVHVGPNLGPADMQVKLTKNQKLTRDRLLVEVTSGALAPPTLKELATSLGQKTNEVESLLNLCGEDGLLVKVDKTLFFSPEALEQARTVCHETLTENGEATMSQLREAWGISRKFAVPLCEFFDQIGVTIRKEDVRIAGPNLDKELSF